MTDFLNFFIDMWKRVIDLLDDTTFEMYGYNVSIFGILFVIIIIGLVVSVFWRGSRT